MPLMPDIEPQIRRAVERHPDVLVAWLFGSSVRGTSGPLSDVDVAVLLDEDGVV